jgi:hypothetical protein
MTIVDQVRTLIERLSPEPVCDDCIADKLSFAGSHQVGIRTRELAGSDGFELQQGRCSICGNAGKVVRRAKR